MSGRGGAKIHELPGKGTKHVQPRGDPAVVLGSRKYRKCKDDLRVAEGTDINLPLQPNYSNL
jgi:hypothetical protein